MRPLRIGPGELYSQITQMNVYECIDLGISFLGLVIAGITLVFLVRYVRATQELVGASVEQLPRPCVVVEQQPSVKQPEVRESVGAVVYKTTASLVGPYLSFVNVGTGPAINVQFHIKPTDNEASRKLPEMAPNKSFPSTHPLDVLPDKAVVTIEFESVARTRYRTETTIEGRKWVTSWRFTT